MGDHGRSMGGPGRSVGVLGGQWGVLRGQWGVMGGQWVVLGGQWEVKGGSRQVTRRLQNAHCQRYSRAEALPVIFWLRYLSKIWVQWRPNKNTKCPIDAHCHRHCRRDPRIGRFWSGWSINVRSGEPWRTLCSNHWPLFWWKSWSPSEESGSKPSWRPSCICTSSVWIYHDPKWWAEQ